MSLTDTAINRAKPREKPFKLADEKGLFLLVSPVKRNGGGRASKLWRLKYRIDGKEKLLALGSYPEITLAQARRQRDAARELVATGTDPSAQRKTDKRRKRVEAANSFEAVAREFVASRAHLWTEDYAGYVLARLSLDMFPALGSRPVASIEPPEILDVLSKIEARGAREMAHRIRGMCGQIFRYGIATQRCTRDPAADLRGAIAPHRGSHLPAVSLSDLPELLRRIAVADGPEYGRNRLTRLALELIAVTMLRTKELRHGRWEQIDLDAGLWVLPIGAMKDKTRDHEVPLSRQAVTVLRELREVTGGFRLLFPGEGKKGVFSENTINDTLHALGYKGRHCGHGFRAVAGTALSEAGWPENWVDHQLHHIEPNESRRPYVRAEYRDGRRKMLQWLADYYDAVRGGKYIEPREFQPKRVIHG